MKRVYLRAFETEDYKILNKIRRNPDVMLYTGGNKFFTSSDYDKKWIEDKIFNNKTQIYLAICLSENDVLIGYTSINNIDHQNRVAEWGGIIISPEFTGKGYATEVGELVLDHVFNQLNINRCCSWLLDSNIASLKMTQKLGFKQEGILREIVYKNGKYQNAIMISLLRKEYDDLKPEKN